MIIATTADSATTAERYNKHINYMIIKEINLWLFKQSVLSDWV